MSALESKLSVFHSIALVRRIDIYLDILTLWNEPEIILDFSPKVFASEIRSERWNLNCDLLADSANACPPESQHEACTNST